MNQMYALVITRKGDTLDVMVSEDIEELKAYANAAEPTTLTWTNYSGSFGAHSERDEEMSYKIKKAGVLA